MASKRQHDGLENHVMNKRLRLSKKTKNISRASRSKPNRPVRRRPAGQAVNVHGDDEDTLVDMFDRSNFAQNKTIAANLQRSDLNNPIWSGFRQTHFPNYVNYAALQPSLRLATKLLRSPVLEPFLLTILNHKKLTTVVSEPPGKAYSRLDSQMRMLAQGRGLVNKRAAIDRAFRELALLVRFGFTQRVEIGASTRANTRLDPGQFTGGVGTHTTTSYSRGSYDRLVRLHGQNTQDLAELTWETFSAGVTFAHEMMHALLVAKMGNVPYEPFFYGEIVAEIGFEMEKRLFSGRPTLIFNGDEGRIYHHYTRNRRSVNTTLVGIPVLFEYPDRGLIDEYRSENDYIGVRTGPNLNEDHLPTYDLAWRIDIARVERYLRNDFWANLPPDDNTALHLPKDLGYYFANEAGDNDRVPRIPDIDDLPDGYNMTANGDVVPLRAGQQRRTRRPRIR